MSHDHYASTGARHRTPLVANAATGLLHDGFGLDHVMVQAEAADHPSCEPVI